MGSIRHSSDVAHPKLARLESEARARGPLRTAVVWPCSVDSLCAAVEAVQRGFIEPVLVGPGARIRALAEEAGLDLDGVRLVEAGEPRTAARAAVELAGAGEVKALMKGSLHTDELLGAVVGRDSPLRGARRASHVFWFDSPAYGKPIMVTDAVVNVAPGLTEKADIVRNAVDLAFRLGIERPKVAILAAVETVNAAMQSTLDATALCKMADRGQIEGAELDGPLGFDNAISAGSARAKGIVSTVAGDPDVLMVPNLDAGNILYKALVYLGGAACAGVVLGAKVPVILTSRADSREARVASCALAALAAGNAA